MLGPGARVQHRFLRKPSCRGHTVAPRCPKSVGAALGSPPVVLCHVTVGNHIFPPPLSRPGSSFPTVLAGGGQCTKTCSRCPGSCCAFIGPSQWRDAALSRSLEVWRWVSASLPVRFRALPCLLHPAPRFFTPGGFGAQLFSAFRQMTKLTLNPQGKMPPQCRESRRFSK